MIETPLSTRGGGAPRIGLIADTHVHAGQVPFPDGVEQALAGVDLIVHLGDMGEASVLDRLAAIAPAVATRGGDDPAAEPRIADARLLIAPPLCAAAAFELGTLLPGAKSEGLVLPEGDLGKHLRERHGRAIRAVAFARTHAPAVFERDGVLFVNPGSATLPASGPRTVAVLELDASPHAELIELR
jgi:putative phosphoesterase